jgi:carbonic anhydrase
MNLEDQRNNLVFTANLENPLGTVYYNLYTDDFGDNYYYFFNCTKLYFRIPGEHVIDENKYDMELQFNCTGEVPGDKSHNKKNVFVAIPVINVEDSEKQSNFFNNFEILMKDNVTTENLPYFLSVDSFDEILNPFNMFSKIFYYIGSTNYPKCMLEAQWIVIENPITIRKSLSQKFFSLFDKDQTVDGNNRKASPKANDKEYFILQNNFSVLTK